ncbi:MAG: glycosyltransferase family 2 protein [Marinilabiliales bacterium]
MTKNPEISVVIPVYNSSKAIEELIIRLKNTFNDIKRSFEIVLVDDNSQDNSWEVMQDVKIKNRDISIKLIKLAENFGQHKATFCGIEHSSGDYIITIDDDLQHPPEEIPKLLTKQEETLADVVYASYIDKKHKKVRNFASKAIKKTLKKIDNSPGDGSSFRLIKREIAQKILQQHRVFVYIDELILWYTRNIAFVPVKHDERKYDKSNYTNAKLAEMSVKIFLFSTTIPLKFMVYGGLVASFISFLLSLYFIYRKIFYNVPLGYTSLIVAILFSTSIIMFSLGMLGEYLSRIFITLHKKPPYLINKIVE